jgi:D-alanyl-D-alanine dipeptidase
MGAAGQAGRGAERGVRPLAVFAAILLVGCAGPGDRAAESRETFRIEPVRPVAELRTEALAATPPAPDSGARTPDLVELRSLDSTIRYDIRYATTNNFMGVAFYDTALAFLQRPAAEAVARAHRRLRAEGFGLLIHDAYRPWYVTKMFWDATPDSLRHFVADPAQGSRHNRGAAVDLSLYDLRTGRAVPMPSGYDEFTERAHPDYGGGTAEQRHRRDRLRAALETEGFTVYQHEWWHYDFGGWERYPVLNLPLRAIPAGREPPGPPRH